MQEFPKTNKTRIWKGTKEKVQRENNNHTTLK